MNTPRTQDPAETVTGVRCRYHCPDLESVDRHLRYLSSGLHSLGDRAPKLVDQYRHDLDLLLARRLYLTMMDDRDDHQ
jgi:hypothetical protein